MADRDFKGVWIPKDIWLDERLNMLEKGILIEIDSLDRSDDGCWAGNEHLAKFCQCSTWKVSDAISKLTKLGYIKVAAFDGRNRKLKSCLGYFQRQTFENPKADMGKTKVSNTNRKNKSISIPQEGKDSDSTSGFDAFYAAYPRHVSKVASQKAWAKLKPNEALQQTILADIARRKRGEWAGKDMQYIPHPSTYLNQRRWEDEQAGQVEEDEYRPTLQEIINERIRQNGGDCIVPGFDKPFGVD